MGEERGIRRPVGVQLGYFKHGCTEVQAWIFFFLTYPKTHNLTMLLGFVLF